MTQIRSDLRFQKEAQNALSCLAEDYSFSCVTATDLTVRYESKKVYIDMIHDLRDCEVYIDFGCFGTDEQYSFPLFLQLVNPALKKSLGDTMVDIPETVAATVNSVAKALQSEEQGIITGDDKVFERMKEVRWWHFMPEALGYVARSDMRWMSATRRNPRPTSWSATRRE